MCLKCKQSQKTYIHRSDCMSMYSELVNLDLQVLDKFSKTKDTDLLLVNKQLRVWISNLSVQCPPLEELALVKTVIYEYTVD